MAVKDYKDLDVWKKGMDLVEEIYSLVKYLPKEETYALSDQMRRAAVSIPSNIAEGQKRRSDKDFSNFLAIARGSNAELETQLLICKRLGYYSDQQAEKALCLCVEISKMLNAFISTLNISSTPEGSSL